MLRTKLPHFLLGPLWCLQRQSCNRDRDKLWMNLLRSISLRWTDPINQNTTCILQLELVEWHQVYAQKQCSNIRSDLLFCPLPESMNSKWFQKKWSNMMYLFWPGLPIRFHLCFLLVSFASGVAGCLLTPRSTSPLRTKSQPSDSTRKAYHWKDPRQLSGCWWCPHFTPQVLIIFSRKTPWVCWGNPPF